MLICYQVPAIYTIGQFKPIAVPSIARCFPVLVIVDILQMQVPCLSVSPVHGRLIHQRRRTMAIPDFKLVIHLSLHLVNLSGKPRYQFVQALVSRAGRYTSEISPEHIPVGCNNIVLVRSKVIVVDALILYDARCLHGGVNALICTDDNGILPCSVAAVAQLRHGIANFRHSVAVRVFVRRTQVYIVIICFLACLSVRQRLSAPHNHLPPVVLVAHIIAGSFSSIKCHAHSHVVLVKLVVNGLSVRILCTEVATPVGYGVAISSLIAGRGHGHHLIECGIGRRHDDLTADTLQFVDDQLEEVGSLRHGQVGYHDGIPHSEVLQLTIAVSVNPSAADSLNKTSVLCTALQQCQCQ